MQDIPRDKQPSRPRPLVSPNNMMPVEVIGREIAAPGVVTLYLAIPGTQQPPAPYLPGQFVTLAIPTPQETLYRSYSLCGDGMPDHPWEITIKRLRDGAVSTYLYDQVRVGSLLYASFPRGTFTLPDDDEALSPLVFVAVGSGITPIIGMLRALSLAPPTECPPTQLHYASRNPEDIIFRDELAAMDPDGTWLQQFHYLSSQQQRLTAEGVIHQVGRMGRRAYWYVCGPESLKHELHALLRARGVPENRILSEVFATQRGATRIDFRVVEASSGSDIAQVRVQETGDVLGAKANETVLATLERHGYQPDYSCRAGTCGMCKQHMLTGKVAAPNALALTNRERADGYILTCVSVPEGDIVLESGGRPPSEGAQRSSGSRTLTTTLLRVGAFAATGGLLLGAWQLTNHRPLSWDAGTANAQAPVATNTGTLGSPRPTTKPGKGKPTPTRVPGQPPPTTIPGQPTATTAPAGQPTATTVPGQPPHPAATATATPVPPPPAPTATSTPSKA